MILVTLMKAQLVAHCNGNPTMARKVSIVRAQHIANLSKDVTLQRRKRCTGRSRIESFAPLSLVRRCIFLRGDDIGQGGNIENQEELGERLLVVLPVARLWVCKILFIDAKKGRSMKNWEQRLPFLEEEIWRRSVNASPHRVKGAHTDILIGKDAGRHFRPWRGGLTGG